MTTIIKKWQHLLILALLAFAPVLGCGSGGHSNVAGGSTPPPTNGGGGGGGTPQPPPTSDWDTITVTAKVKNASSDKIAPMIGAVNWGLSYDNAYLEVTGSNDGWTIYEGSYTPKLYAGIHFNGDDVCLFLQGSSRDDVRFAIDGHEIKWYTTVDGRKDHQCGWYENGNVSAPHIAHKSLDDVNGDPITPPPPTQNGTTVYNIHVTYMDTDIAPRGDIKDVFIGYSDVAGDWHAYATTDTHQTSLHGDEFQWQVTNGGSGLSTIFVQPSELHGNKDFRNVTDHGNGVNELTVNNQLVCWNIKGRKMRDGQEHAYLKIHWEGNEIVFDVDANRHAVFGGVGGDDHTIKMPPKSIDGYDDQGKPVSYEVVAGAGWGNACPGNFPVK